MSACKTSSSVCPLKVDKWVNLSSGVSIKFSFGSFDAFDCASKVISLFTKQTKKQHYFNRIIALNLEYKILE